MKGQVSTELIIIIGVILVLFIPVLITIYLKATEANEQIASFQSDIALSRLANTVNSIGQLGEDAYTIAEVHIPAEAEKIEFNNFGEGGEIVIQVQLEGSISELVEVVKFPMAASPEVMDNPHEGIHRFRITNQGEQVAVELLS